MKRRRAHSLWLVGALAACVAACSHSPRVLSPAEPISVDQAAARDIISAYRREHGLGPLVVDPSLQAAAAAQAMAMASAGELSHTVAGTLAQRLDAAHIQARAADENVSGGYATLAAAIQGWRQSPPHDANLLDPKMTRMGLGGASSPTARYHQYWSLILAQ